MRAVYIAGVAEHPVVGSQTGDENIKRRETRANEDDPGTVWQSQRSARAAVRPPQGIRYSVMPYVHARMYGRHANVAQCVAAFRNNGTGWWLGNGWVGGVALLTGNHGRQALQRAAGMVGAGVCGAFGWLRYGVGTGRTKHNNQPGPATKVSGGGWWAG